MLIIRLLRIGKKNQPSFRLVLTEKTAPPRGKFLEVLGKYNPRLKEISLKEERIKYWLSQGVQTSDTVHNLLVSQGVIKGPKKIKKIPARQASQLARPPSASPQANAGRAGEAGGKSKKKKKIEEKPEEKKEENLDKSEEKSKIEAD